MQIKAKPPPWSGGGFLTDCSLAASQYIGSGNRLGSDILQEYGRMAAAYNPAAIDRGWPYDRPLIVHPTPLGWGRGRGAGIAVLNWLEYLPLHLGNVQRFVPPSEGVSRRLRQALYTPDVRMGWRARP